MITGFIEPAQAVMLSNFKKKKKIQQKYDVKNDLKFKYESNNIFINEAPAYLIFRSMQCNYHIDGNVISADPWCPFISMKKIAKSSFVPNHSP